MESIRDEHLAPITAASAKALFREEQEFALQTLGNWQQDGYKSYSTYSFSSLNETCSTFANSVASVVDSSVTAAILAKKRVLKWQEERSHSRESGRKEILEKTLSQDSTLFKVPPPKRVVLKLDLHNWYFGLRSQNWVLIGKFTDDRGKTKKYTSKSLLKYFERKKGRKICSLDGEKILVLSGAGGFPEQSGDEVLHHPDFIKKKFAHGFPQDWKEVLEIWQEYELKCQPEDYSWPADNTSLNSTCCTISTNFTSVTDRIAPVTNAEKECSTNFNFVIPRNIGVEVDSRYSLKKFLDQSTGPSNQLSNCAELSAPKLGKKLSNILEISAPTACKQFPNLAELSVPGTSRQPAQQKSQEPQAISRHGSNGDNSGSRVNDNTVEPRVSHNPISQNVGSSETKLPSNVTNCSSCSPGKVHPLREVQPTSQNSLKGDCSESQRVEPRVLRSPTTQHADAGDTRLPSNACNRSSSSSRKCLVKQPLLQQQATPRQSLKGDRVTSRKNGKGLEPRIIGSDESLNSVTCKTGLTSKAPNHSISSCNKQPITSKDNNSKSQEKNDRLEPRIVHTPISLHVYASDTRLPSNVASQTSRSRKKQGELPLQEPQAKSRHHWKENHSKSCKRNDDREEPRILRNGTSECLDVCETVLKPNSLKRINQTVPKQPMEENRTQPLAENQRKRDLCGKAVDPRCSVERCLCASFPKPVIVVKLTKIDAIGTTDHETANNFGERLHTSQAAPDLCLQTKKSGRTASVFSLKNWSPVIMDTNGDNELRLVGDIINPAGCVVENRHTTWPIQAIVNGIIRCSDGKQYTLVGKLSSTAKKDVPGHILSCYFKNDLFPKHWKKMILEWSNINKRVGSDGSASILSGTRFGYLSKLFLTFTELRLGTRQRKQPIQFWKVGGGTTSKGTSADDKPHSIDFNEKKRANKFEKVTTKHGSKTSKNNEAKVHKTRQRSQSSCSSSSEEEIPIRRTRSRSQKTTKMKCNDFKADKCSPRETPLVKEPISIRARLKRSNQTKSSCNAPERGIQERSSCNRLPNSEKPIAGRSGNKWAMKNFLNESPLPKRKCQGRYKSCSYSSDKSSDVNVSGDESPWRALTSKRRHQLSDAVGEVNSKKLIGEVRNSHNYSCSDSDEYGNLGSRDLETLSRCHPRQIQANRGQTFSKLNQLNNLKPTSAHSTARSCTDKSDTSAKDASKATAVKSGKVISGPTTSLCFGSKVKLHPWERNADLSLDSDSDEPEVPSPIGPQRLDKCSAKEVYLNAETISCSADQIRNSSAKRTVSTKPVSDSEGLTKVAVKVHKSNYQSIAMPINGNSGSATGVNEATSYFNENVEDVTDDNLSFGQSVFSETDPRASYRY